MDEIPKALGLPPVSDGMLQNALTNTAVTATTMNGGAGVTPSPGGGTGPSPLAAIMGNGTEALNSDAASLGSESEDGVVNPLAGMGFSDEE